MKIKLLFICLFVFTTAVAQVSTSSGIYLAKEFSKDQALYKAKEYVMTQIIGVDLNLTKFEIDPLAAASSGELTSLVYFCDEKQLSGMVLGFYGDRWNESGVIFQAYAFRNFTEKQALEILSKIDAYIDEESNYLISDPDNNNMFFKYDDMIFLIYRDGTNKIRVFWNGFDSEWESTAFGRTKRRFERKLKN